MKTWFTLMQTRYLTVRAHYTWLLVLALGLWSLATVALPARLGSDAGRWLPAFLIMAVYIAIVALHELAHLLVAKLLRVPMPALNVHPIGTLARIGHEPVGPVRTFAVAAAGPLANIMLWLVLRTIDATTGTIGGEVINFARSFSITLGLVNLLPGLPLDGGRMLRAVVWFGSSFHAGTRVATIVGYIVAAGTLFLGLRTLANPETTLRGMWIVLLAWLIYAAGTSLMRRRVVATLFNRLTARDVMVPVRATADPEITLRELVESWRGGTGENPTPVVEDGRLLGVITWSLASDVPQGYWEERTVGATMQPINDMSTIPPMMSLSHVLPQIDTDEFHPMPLFVTEDTRLLGVIEPHDLVPLLDVQDALGMQHPAPSFAEHYADRPQRIGLHKRQGSVS